MYIVFILFMFFVHICESNFVYVYPNTIHDNSRPATTYFTSWLDETNKRTYNKSNASWFFVPSSCSIHPLPSYKRHVFGICSGDNGFVTTNIPEDAILLSMYGLKHGFTSSCEHRMVCKGKMRSYKDVVVPGLQRKGRDEDIFLQYPAYPRTHIRRDFFFFSGSIKAFDNRTTSKGMNVRVVIKELYENTSGYIFKFKHAYEYVNQLLNTQFCLSPLGMHGGWGSRWKHAVLTGCIPVIFDAEYFLQPYQMLFDPNAYGIVLSYDNVTKMNAILKSISEHEIYKKRSMLLDMRDKVLWTRNSSNTLYSLINQILSM